MRYLSIIILIGLLSSCSHTQTSSKFDMRQAVGDMMQLEQTYEENKDSNVANELIRLYEAISEHSHDTNDYYTLAHCRMLAEVHRYDEAIALSDALIDKDKPLFKERLYLMKACYSNDTAAFNHYLGNILNYLEDLTSKHEDLLDSTKRIPLYDGYSDEDPIYWDQMFRLKYSYLSVVNGLDVTCQQLTDRAQSQEWDADQYNLFLKRIREFDYMSLTWW